MKWTEPNDGDIKIKRKFALFPICINDENRWLEWVTIKYEYCIRRPYRNHLTGELFLFTGWLAIEFVDDYERDMEYVRGHRANVFTWDDVHEVLQEIIDEVCKPFIRSEE